MNRSSKLKNEKVPIGSRNKKINISVSLEDDLPFGKCEDEVAELEPLKKSGRLPLSTPTGNKPIGFLANNFSEQKIFGARRSMGFGA